MLGSEQNFKNDRDKLIFKDLIYNSGNNAIDLIA